MIHYKYMQLLNTSKMLRNTAEALVIFQLPILHVHNFTGTIVLIVQHPIVLRGTESPIGIPTKYDG